MTNYVPKLRIAGCEIPYGAVAGLSEVLDTVHKTEVRRTVNGDPIVLRSRWPRKYRLSVRSGEGRWTAAFDGLVEGETYPVEIATHLTARIPAGTASVTLARTPVPGSVIVHPSYGRDAERLDYDLAGRVVSIDPQVGVVTVKYRPALSMILVKLYAGSAETEGRINWAMDLEEV